MLYPVDNVVHSLNNLGQVYMLWFNFILGLNFIFFCFKLIIIHYHTQKQKKIKFKPRRKLNHNIYNVNRYNRLASNLGERRHIVSCIMLQKLRYKPQPGEQLSLIAIALPFTSKKHNTYGKTKSSDYAWSSCLQ